MSYQLDNIILNENTNDCGVISHLAGGLPDLPLTDELSWVSANNFSVPPINRMLHNSIISARLKSQTQKNSIVLNSVSVTRPHIPPESLISLGLPKLPEQLSGESDSVEILHISTPPSDVSGKSADQNKSENSKDIHKCSVLSQYGTDEKALGNVLATTSLLIERMSTQSAVDCLIEMPVWMRNIFLARFGISRVVGVMLASRLDAAGEMSIVGSDGEVCVHNVPGPSVEILSDYQLSFVGSKLESQLDQLVMARRTRNIGIKIKNNHKTIHQMPIERDKYLRRLG